MILHRHTPLDVAALHCNNKSRQIGVCVCMAVTLIVCVLVLCAQGLYLCMRMCVCDYYVALMSLDQGQHQFFSDRDCSPSVSQEMATSDPCPNAPPTPPEEPEPSPSPRKKRGRRKLEQSEKNKGTDQTQSH